MDVVTAEQHSMEEKGRTPPATGNPMLGAFRDSIRRIKVQKQRPGFDRMAQTLKTHHQISDVRAIKEQLDEAVKEGLLLTVWTKGLQCYKDPESLRSLRKFSVASLADARRAVKQAVREIGDPEGSKLAVIENYVGHSYVVKTAALSTIVATALEQMTKKGNLISHNNRFKAVGQTLAQNSTSNVLLASLESSLDPSDQEATSPPPPSKARSTPKQDTPPPPPPPPTPPAIPLELAATSPDHSPASEYPPAKRKETVGQPKKFTMIMEQRSPKKLHFPEDDDTPFGPLMCETRSPLKSSAIVEMEVERVAPMRVYLTYQCWCCTFFTGSLEEFFVHVRGVKHKERTEGKCVECSSCRFRTQDRLRLLEHLGKYDCHVGRSSVACLLSFSAFVELMADAPTLTKPSH